MELYHHHGTCRLPAPDSMGTTFEARLKSLKLHLSVRKPSVFSHVRVRGRWPCGITSRWPSLLQLLRKISLPEDCCLRFRVLLLLYDSLLEGSSSFCDLRRINAAALRTFTPGHRHNLRSPFRDCNQCFLVWIRHGRGHNDGHEC